MIDNLQLPYMVNGGKSCATCSLNSRCHWSMAQNSITVTGTLVHTSFHYQTYESVSPVQSWGKLHMKHPPLLKNLQYYYIILQYVHP